MNEESNTNSSFFREIRELPFPVRVMAVGSFVDRFGTFIMPFLIIFLTDAGLSRALAAVAAGMFGLGGLFASFLSGFLTDWIGRRKTMVLSMYSSAIVGILLYLSAVHADKVGGYWLTFVLTFCYGLCRILFHPASSSLVGDLVPAGKRVPAFALLRFAVNLGWGCGMACAGFLAEYSFAWLFVIDASTSLVFGTLALFLLPHGLRSTREQSQWAPALRIIVRDKPFMMLCLNCLIFAIVLMQWSTSYAAWLKGMEYPERTYGLIMALNGLLIVVFEMPVNAWLRRFRAPLVIAFGTMLAGIGFGINGLVSGMGGLILAKVVFTFGEMAVLPMQAAWVAELAPESMRGRYNGIMALTWSTSSVFAASIGMAMLDLDQSVLFIGMTSLAILSGVLLIFREKMGRAPQVHVMAGETG